MVLNEWNGSKPSFDFVQRADYCRLMHNRLEVKLERVFGKDALVALGLCARELVVRMYIKNR